MLFQDSTTVPLCIHSDFRTHKALRCHQLQRLDKQVLVHPRTFGQAQIAEVHTCPRGACQEAHCLSLPGWSHSRGGRPCRASRPLRSTEPNLICHLAPRTTTIMHPAHPPAADRHHFTPLHMTALIQALTTTTPTHIHIPTPSFAGTHIQARRHTHLRTALAHPYPLSATPRTFTKAT